MRTLTTERLTIEPMAPGHGARLARFFRENASHFARWDPPRPPSTTTSGYWEAECARAAREHEAGSAARWLVFERGDVSRLIARANFTQIVRGPFQSCMLGYAIDASFEGRGMMAEALRATIAHAFDELELHRIQANYVPENERSARLLERLGFEREGLAPRYLYIAGAWRDHVLTALLNPDFDDSVFGART